MRYEVGGRAVTGWLRTLEPRRSYYWLKASRTLARALVGDPLESALLYLVISSVYMQRTDNPICYT